MVLLAILAVFLFTTLRQGRETVETVAISKIAAEIKAGKIEAISEKDGELSVTYKGASAETPKTRSRIEEGAKLVETLNILGVTNEELEVVKVEFPPSSMWENWAPILGAFLPIVLIGAFFFFILRQAQGSGNQAFSFGKSKARMFTGDKPTVTFGSPGPAAAGSESALAPGRVGFAASAGAAGGEPGPRPMQADGAGLPAGANNARWAGQ